MFCKECGKELNENWEKCPYCGKDTGINDSIKEKANPSERNIAKKKKTPFIVGRIIVIILIIAILLVVFGNNKSTDEKKEESKQVVELSEYEGGYESWKADGFPGSVRTDIVISYPLQNTDRNNYAIYIGKERLNTGVIMQEDETAVSEWKWLKEAEPDYETKAYYFKCTLTYTGKDVGEENQLPVFIIKDVESYYSAEAEKDDYIYLQEFIDLVTTFSNPPEFADSEYYKQEYDLWKSGEAYNYITLDKSGHLTIEDHSAEFVGDWYDTYSQRCGMSIDSDGVNYYIEIDWGSSAQDNTHWSFAGTYDSDINGIIYRGSCVEEHYLDSGAIQKTTIYTDGIGTIYRGDDGILYWEDDEEHVGDICSFERWLE